MINGRSFDLDAALVEARCRGLRADPVQQHAVVVGGVEYPVKQVLSVATGLPRTDFTSHRARDVLRRLGFTTTARDGVTAPRASAERSPAYSGAEWAWEGHVQDLFVAFLSRNGWTVTATADTASKQHGVDVVAEKGHRKLGAEVKGWPSKGYADPRRAAEEKRTQPTTQAGHWFSQALMKAIMLLDTHPGHESLVVVPDYPRYRDLARRTATGRGGGPVHVVFVAADGSAHGETWQP